MSKKEKTKPDPTEFNLPPGGADSHAHLDDEEYTQDLPEVLARAFKAGVTSIGNVFTSVTVWQQHKDTLGAFAGVFFQLGIHPCEADLWAAQKNAVQAALKEDRRIKAVGEIGLDYYWDNQPRALQQEVFIAQLRMARKFALPVSIHCREAEQDTLRILQNENFTGYPLLWHCFGGDKNLAAEILKQGWHISVPGPVTFKKNVALREAVQHIPLSRLHLETDCPYLAPEPWRGKRNEPAFVAFTAARVAEIKEIPLAELWLACGENTKEFFGLTRFF